MFESLDYDALDLARFGQIALAGLLGGMIGVERELADKPAGLRTHILVAAGSALLVFVGEGAVEFFQHSSINPRIQADPIRVIQAIVVGISFLGAGTIVQHQNRHVEGLTTAASISLTAGIGIAVAVGRTWLAIETALFALFVLLLAGWVERWLSGDSEGAAPDPREDVAASPRPGTPPGTGSINRPEEVS